MKAKLFKILSISLLAVTGIATVAPLKSPVKTDDFEQIDDVQVVRGTKFTDPSEEVYVTDYDNMTIRDFCDSPTTSGLPDPIIDKDGYIQFSTPNNTIGYQLFQKSFVMTFDLYFDQLPYAANFWIAIRANTWTRANYVPNCYFFRFSTFGEVEIYKSFADETPNALLSTGYFKFNPEIHYTINLCSVLTNKNTMLLSVGINGKVYSSYEDVDPHTHTGMMIFTADGAITPTLTNASTLTYVFNQKVSETEASKNVQLFFMNSVCSTDKTYNELTKRMLNSIYLGDKSVAEINEIYYALDADSNHINAVDMFFKNNVLNLVINKSIYQKSDDSPVAFDPSTLWVKKTETDKGLVSDSGYWMIFDYHLDLKN